MHGHGPPAYHACVRSLLFFSRRAFDGAAIFDAPSPNNWCNDTIIDSRGSCRPAHSIIGRMRGPSAADRADGSAAVDISRRAERSSSNGSGRKDSVTRPYSKADINFMTGMIAHHGAGDHMASWAPTHGASPSIQTLCARIINAQNDEIRLMQAWLRDRGASIPQPDPDGMCFDEWHAHARC